MGSSVLKGEMIDGSLITLTSPLKDVIVRKTQSSEIEVSQGRSRYVWSTFISRLSGFVIAGHIFRLNTCTNLFSLFLKQQIFTKGLPRAVTAR
jgi:hypothetical protein